MKRNLPLAAVLALGFFVSGQTSAPADEIPEKYRETVRKGLDWLASKQHDKGYWGAGTGEQYQTAMTALSGMALLMEGSTIREGKYSKSIRKAVDYLMANVHKGGDRDGLIGAADVQGGGAGYMSRYMYGHGFSLLFLASVYGDEDNPIRRGQLKEILTKAVKYAINAQSSRGGWYYTSKTEGGDRDEGSVTITQVQALRAAKNAGIPVPADAIKKCYGYLKECTSPSGGVYYSFQSKNERAAVTAAAIACLFNAGQYNDELCKKWFKYCQRQIPFTLGGPQGNIRIGHDEYTHYYYSQCVYILGDDGWEKMFGPTPPADRVTWTKYREALFDQLMRTQNQDGGWSSGGGFSVGPVYSTALYLTIMQLDKGTLPIYQK